MFKDVTDTFITTTPINAMTNYNQITEKMPLGTQNSTKIVYNTSTTSVMDITTESNTYEQSTFTMSTAPSFENNKRPSTRKDDQPDLENYNRSTTVRQLDLETTTHMSTFPPLPMGDTSSINSVIEITTEGFKEISTISVNKICSTLKDCSSNEKCLNGQCIKICDSETSDTVCIKGITHFVMIDKIASNEKFIETI